MHLAGEGQNQSSNLEKRIRFRPYISKKISAIKHFFVVPQEAGEVCFSAIRDEKIHTYLVSQNGKFLYHRVFDIFTEKLFLKESDSCRINEKSYKEIIVKGGSLCLGSLGVGVPFLLYNLFWKTKTEKFYKMLDKEFENQPPQTYKN